MKVAPGVFADRHGLRAFVRTKDKRLRSCRFPADKLAAAKQWREDQRHGVLLKQKLAAPVAAPAGTLRADAARYLLAVQGMPTIADRTRHVMAWVDALGDRPRATLTPVDVRRTLESWRSLGASPGTLNLRRTALMHLFNVLDVDGRAVNPVARVPRYREPETAILAPSPKQIAKVLSTLPDGRYKRILTVAAWTGWPYAQILALTPPDLSRLKQGVARVTPRKKGGGAEGRWLPLLPEAIKALRALKLPDDLTGFHRRVAWAIWRKGCEAAKVEPCRPYDLRHAFGTRIASASHDARAVKELMLHSTLEQSLRYTEAAGAIRAADAIRLVTKSKVTRGRKSPARSRSRRKPKRKS